MRFSSVLELLTNSTLSVLQRRHEAAEGRFRRAVAVRVVQPVEILDCHFFEPVVGQEIEVLDGSIFRYASTSQDIVSMTLLLSTRWLDRSTYTICISDFSIRAVLLRAITVQPLSLKCRIERLDGVSSIRSS